MTEQSKPADSSSQMPSIPPLELGDLSMAPSSPGESDSTDPTKLKDDHQSRAGAEDPQKTAQTADKSQSDTTAQNSTSAERPSHDGPPGPLPPIDTSAPPMTRQMSEAIGPSTDLPTPMLQPGPSALAAGPIIQFTLLLASTGTRHPFQINERYLTKRNVKATGADGNFDPSTISVYNLKELILKDWREDWDAKPSSPSAIRLIFFGQLLADNISLKECKLQTDGTANVLHITVKPQEVMDDEEAGKGKSSMSRDRDGNGGGVGCRCVIL